MKRFLCVAIAVVVIVAAFAVVASAQEGTEPEETISINEGDIVVPGGLTEEQESLWHQFWGAIISVINGQNARDAIVTLCSIAGATIVILLKSAVSSRLSQISSISTNNTKKTNELVSGVNENSENIKILASELVELEKRTQEILATESARTDDGCVTKEGILALADMIMTTYQSSSTIPNAAKEIIRKKYLAVIDAMSDGETKEA